MCSASATVRCLHGFQYDVYKLFAAVHHLFCTVFERVVAAPAKKKVKVTVPKIMYFFDNNININNNSSMLFVETIEICTVQLQSDNYIPKICNETNLPANLMLCVISFSVDRFFWSIFLWHRVCVFHMFFTSHIPYFPSVLLDSACLFSCWYFFLALISFVFHILLLTLSIKGLNISVNRMK